MNCTLKTRYVAATFAAAALILAGPLSFAQIDCIEFDTSLTTLNLSGGPYPMPLASDPGNALGDSVDGFGFVDSQVDITLSSQRAVSPGPQSLGQAFAFQNGEAAKSAEDLRALLKGVGGGCSGEVDPAALDGELFFVDSFFDVFFDITVTDVDPRAGRNFAGQADGASFQLLDNGPASMSSFYNEFFDMDHPNYGLVPPPQADPYIGHFQIVIPLGADINGNASTEPQCAPPNASLCDDKIKFTLASHAAGDGNRQFIILPDGTVIDEFDSAAFLDGAILDTFMDPPFTLGAGSSGSPAFSGPGSLAGPTTATSQVQNSVTGPGVPSASTLGLMLLGVLMLGLITLFAVRMRMRTES